MKNSQWLVCDDAQMLAFSFLVHFLQLLLVIVQGCLVLVLKISRANDQKFI